MYFKFLGAMAAGLCALVAIGCAARHYTAAPFLPEDSASELEARNLADPKLESYIAQSLGHPISPWPVKTWDLPMLSLAALYFNTAMQGAQARVAEAGAAILTAGARPNPTLSLAPGIPSPYLFSLDFAFPFETAGKRKYRTEAARSLNQAAQFEFAQAAWTVRSAVRAALLDYVVADRHSNLLGAQRELQRQRVRRLEQRQSAGEIPRTDVDAARIDLAKLDLAVTSSAGQTSVARAALAASIGVPAATIHQIDFAWSGWDSPPNAQTLSPDVIQRAAVINRLDVRRSLAQYAAAEADLRLEIAKQYPDFDLGPGYTYEERNGFFTVGFETTIPLFNRNQGPIAEAEARRSEAAASFLQTQAQVISESEKALAQYSAARRELDQIDQALQALQDNRLRAVEKSVAAGEEDQLALNAVQIEDSSLAETRLTKLAATQTALGRLEDAVQRPLDPGDALTLDIGASSLTKLPKEPSR